MYLYHNALIMFLLVGLLVVAGLTLVQSNKIFNEDNSQIHMFSQRKERSGKGGKGDDKSGTNKRGVLVELKKTFSNSLYPNGQIETSVVGGDKNLYPRKPEDPPKPEVKDGRAPAPIVPLGGYPNCCTICTRKFYRGLALLELPQKIEKQTLDNFHAAYSHVLGSFDKQPNVENVRQTGDTKNSRVQIKTHKNKKNELFKMQFLEVGMSKKRRRKRKGPKGSKKAGSGFRNIGKNLQKASGIHSEDRASQSTSNVGYNDITQRLYRTIENVKKVPGSLKKKWIGQAGPGPCCNICPTWFVPHNSPKTWSRGVPGLPDYGGPDPAEREPTFIETMENSKSNNNHTNPLGNGGFSQCCNVCTSGDTELPLEYNMFLEIKEKALSRAKTNSKSQTRNEINIEAKSKHRSFLHAMHNVKLDAPAREGQCCYMCTLDANGGWDSSEPFSDPQSEAQSITTKSTDEETMRKIAFYRTYFHGGTVDHRFANGLPSSNGEKESNGG